MVRARCCYCLGFLNKTIYIFGGWIKDIGEINEIISFDI